VRLLGDHALLIFALVAIGGLISGIIAGVKQSKGWLIVALLNAVTFLLEFVVS